MSTKKKAKKRTRPQKEAQQARRYPPAQRRSVFEAVLLLPGEYLFAPLASLLVCLATALLLRPAAALFALGWLTTKKGAACGACLLDLGLVQPLRMARRAWRWAARTVDRLFLFPQAEARALRASVSRLEQRLRHAELRLKKQHKHLQRLLRHTQASLTAPPSLPCPQGGEARSKQQRHKDEAPPAVPAVAAPPLPPPPPPPPVAALPRCQSAGGAQKTTPKTVSSAAPTSVVSMQDLLRVKLKPSRLSGRASAKENSPPMALLSTKQTAKALSVSLADITNVQLRRTQRPPSSTLGRATAPSPNKAPLSFKLRRVEGIERSPGGTPIRSDFAKSSQNNTTDKFALALKKKFESSLVNSPPSSAPSSPTSFSPDSGSLNGSFGSTPLKCFSPSVSFCAPSPIRSDKL